MFWLHAGRLGPLVIAYVFLVELSSGHESGIVARNVENPTYKL